MSHIADAVTASARWDSATKCFVERDSFDKFYPRDTGLGSVSYGSARGYGVASVTCPIAYRDTSPGSPEWFPNFDLAVNFTGLLGSVKPGSAYNRDIDAVRVYVGLTNDTVEIVQNTEPVLLFPGTNMLSVIRPVFREKIQRQGLTILGLEVSSLSGYLYAAS
jgi:hypothetical protein